MMALSNSNKRMRKFRAAVEIADLAFPVTEIANKMNYSKGNISAFLSGKKTVPNEFLENFIKLFDVKSDLLNEKMKETDPENEISKLNLLLREKDLRLADKDMVISMQEKEIERLKNEIKELNKL